MFFILRYKLSLPMKKSGLYYVARKAINTLKKQNSEGISITELVHQLSVPKRRVYDIKLLLEGIGLIESKKKGGESYLYWKTVKKEEASGKITCSKVEIQFDGEVTSVSNKGNIVLIESKGENVEIDILE